MTEVQETKIRELRLKGLGYRRIATEAGLSRDIVRNYCRSKGMAGYASFGKECIGTDFQGQSLFVLWKGNRAACHRASEEVLFGNLPEKMVEGTPNNLKRMQ
ncbi:hypothetical protein C8E03_109123 [Lachnotalea glycerini]|jgi:hypothetical protein|uniref:Uncharacterized protein n=1 Tax=Lachnotalea glycerini TaxID=1763509 RepID=A0A255IQ22_9FIRM|nr:hypothetical protein C8E03_109123 [Lachnotalea glycerini]RDY30237.1 hypothetical protein CG710_015585 [Lachnotalea glycerini]